MTNTNVTIELYDVTKCEMFFGMYTKTYVNNTPFYKELSNNLVKEYDDIKQVV